MRMLLVGILTTSFTIIQAASTHLEPELLDEDGGIDEMQPPYNVTVAIEDRGIGRSIGNKTLL